MMAQSGRFLLWQMAIKMPTLPNLMVFMFKNMYSIQYMYMYYQDVLAYQQGFPQSMLSELNSMSFMS